eukprot:UN15091
MCKYVRSFTSTAFWDQRPIRLAWCHTPTKLIISNIVGIVNSSSSGCRNSNNSSPSLKPIHELNGKYVFLPTQ